MIMQAFFDHFINFEGWKCLNCGKIIEKRENTIKDDAFSVFYQRQKIKKQDKVNNADSAFIFLIIQSQNQWSGWSGRRRWPCLVWSLLER